MAQCRRVYHDQDGVRRTVYWEDDKPDDFGINTEVDVSQLVDNNKALAELHPQRSMNKLVARVPLTVYEQSLREKWDESKWKRWLNDSDNRAFRVWQGQV